MKRMVWRRLSWIIAIGMLLSLVVNYYLQIQMAHRDMEDESQALFWQIEQILEENEIETEKVKQEFKDACLVKARAAAYTIQNKPEIEKNFEEIKRVAELLQIDELHLFDENGTIYAGTVPKYYGYNFHSGEQMEFFLPMLEDKTLELCQPITPNTAEGKMMQYSAVWREDGKGIVQIGMEPERVLEITKKNELSYIFSLLTEDAGADMYAVDPNNYKILGSTEGKLVGKKLTEIGIEKELLDSGERAFHATLDGKKQYFVFEEQNGVLLGRGCSTDKLHRGVNESTMFLGVYLLALGVVMLVSITRYLDKKIIRAIASVNGKLQNITEGDLDENVEVHETPEFSELSSHVNQMVDSILATTDKLSSILDMAQTPIGAYEYSYGMSRVRVTSKVPEILGWTEEQKDQLLSNYVLFRDHLAEIKKYPAEAEDSVFRLPWNPDKYIEIESHTTANSIFGVLIDVTEDIHEKRVIEHERDEDLLTGLGNRRAFYRQMEELFRNPEELKHAVVIMIDTDDLKKVNDLYGHEVGDFYLRGMADILRTCTADRQISARLSGDEFAMLLYGYEDKNELQQYIHELEKYQDRFEVNDGAIILAVKYSMGCAFYPEDGKAYSDLLKCADKRMYELKRQKKMNQD